ncbi:hypothetical protein [Methanobrevibacter arboriphilus]|uniref:hypothetical protein n=1 Tax=Methanobrevibacter arboriphilus TaxID=39441 RepID=UPI001CDA6BC2|nr:hypothetical protein [Methanobrevibacter arboriphilus]
MGNLKIIIFLCVDEERIIYYGDSLPISSKITTREGVVEYIVDNYHNNSYDDLQEGTWNITQKNQFTVGRISRFLHSTKSSKH